jgi:hypothetical protein
MVTDGRAGAEIVAELEMLATGIVDITNEVNWPAATLFILAASCTGGAL